MFDDKFQRRECICFRACTCMHSLVYAKLFPPEFKGLVALPPVSLEKMQAACLCQNELPHRCPRLFNKI